MEYVSWNIWAWSCSFFSAPGLAWLAALKLDLLTDTDMTLMVEKSIRGGICHAIYGYRKANNKSWMIIIKIKNDCILLPRHVHVSKWIYTL